MYSLFSKLVSYISILLLDFFLFLGVAFSVSSVFGYGFDVRNMQLPYFVLFVSYFLIELYAFKSYLIWDEIIRIFKAVLFSFGVIAFIYAYLRNYDGIVTIFTILFFYIPASIFGRYLLRITLNFIGIFKIKAIIVGNGFQGKEFESIVSNNRFTGYKIVGFVKYGKDGSEGKKVLGDIKGINAIIKKYKIDEVIIAVPRIARNELGKIIYQLEGEVKRIKFIPDMYGLITFSTQINDYDKVLTISTTQGLLDPMNRIYKRIFDIFGALVGLALLVPISIISYIFIKLEDGKEVVFKQDRLGLNGQRIKIWKFRTMIPNAEQVLEDIMAKDSKIRDEYLNTKKLKNDPRITKFGKILRKTSLDEFPQFINVLKGEMSIVGPRPYLFREIDDMGDKYRSIIQTKPGITGLWQASGRNELSFDERIILDQYYVRNWDIWFDIIIILKTMRSLVRGKGAY